MLAGVLIVGCRPSGRAGGRPAGLLAGGVAPPRVAGAPAAGTFRPLASAWDPAVPAVPARSAEPIGDVWTLGVPAGRATGFPLGRRSTGPSIGQVRVTGDAAPARGALARDTAVRPGGRAERVAVAVPWSRADVVATLAGPAATGSAVARAVTAAGARAAAFLVVVVTVVPVLVVTVGAAAAAVVLATVLLVVAGPAGPGGLVSAEASGVGDPDGVSVFAAQPGPPPARPPVMIGGQRPADRSAKYAADPAWSRARVLGYTARLASGRARLRHRRATFGCTAHRPRARARLRQRLIVTPIALR
ncbi:MULTISPECIES: hypothetical protein [Pseudofrankia]|uniref:hypothetical protein n=1 Tax=Pseudofrankia TaxID=2994363 RepID=UPI000234B586|nr:MULTISPECIES: hypothetical protein [Pseudofrankia]OHV36450.1 hypothetical protein BCD49_19610 [Pseudofrankia sp. EUN1h]